MKLSVSALAWLSDEHKAALTILKQSNIKAIELVPGRIVDIFKEKEHLRKFNLNPVAFQSLLFGTQGLHLFQSHQQREALSHHLKTVALLSEQLAIPHMIFGSPQHRWIDESILTLETAQSIALDFFGELNSFLSNHGVILCLEPNPTAYQCNFLTTTEATGTFVKTLNCSHIKLNLDLGAVSMNQENLTEILNHFHDEIRHIHISEPQLAPVLLKADKTYHSALANTLHSFLPQLKTQIASIEMKRPPDGLAQLASIIQTTQKIYGRE